MDSQYCQLRAKSSGFIFAFVFETVEADCLEVDGFSTGWVEPLKQKLSEAAVSAEGRRLWLTAAKPNGTIGLVNCIRQEDGGSKLRYVSSHQYICVSVHVYV